MLSVIASFLYNFLYLLIGYWFTEMDGYLICWTMPGCVLCLRLIGKYIEIFFASTNTNLIVLNDKIKKSTFLFFFQAYLGIVMMEKLQQKKVKMFSQRTNKKLPSVKPHPS